MDVNTDRLNAFMGKMVSDMGAAMNASLVLLGDKLGLYKALADKGPMNSTELAKATGTAERYVREWLATQAASGYIDYDAASGKFSMQPEQSWRLPTRTARCSSARSATWSRRHFWMSRRFRMPSRPARASAGTGAANACSAALRASSGQAISTIWCRNGCPRWTAWWRSSSAGPRSPTSAAGTAYRRG
jgi:hypothetical protein